MKLFSVSDGEKAFNSKGLKEIYSNKFKIFYRNRKNLFIKIINYFGTDLVAELALEGLGKPDLARIRKLTESALLGTVVTCSVFSGDSKVVWHNDIWLLCLSLEGDFNSLLV